MGDHTESISIDYDPARIRYEDLLALFWESHCSERNHPGPQYRNAIFYRDDRQRAAAEASRLSAAGSLGIAPDQIQTHLVAATTFTYAEKYHQKYVLTRFPEIRSFLDDAYPSVKDFADSAVGTRLNAWLGSGWQIDPAIAREEAEGFGLGDRLLAQVLRSIRCS